jgi:hypothetical protein
VHGHHQEPNAGVGTHSKWLSSTPAAGILGSAFLRLLANVCILETKNRIPVCGVQYSFFSFFVQVVYYYLLLPVIKYSTGGKNYVLSLFLPTLLICTICILIVRL